MASNTATIQARVTPELDRQFKLAAQLDGRSASSAMRHLMATYIEAMIGRTSSEAAPGGERPRSAIRNDLRQSPQPTEAGAHAP